MSFSIAEVLEKLNLTRYLPNFIEHEIECGDLQYLTKEDLEEIGIVGVGPKRRLLTAFQSLADARPQFLSPFRW